MIGKNIKYIILKNLNKSRIMFYHLAKCGGMSTTYALLKSYRPWNLISHQAIFQLSETPTRIAEESQGDGSLSFRQRMLIYALASPNVRLAAGHFELSPDVFGVLKSDWTFATVIRDPVDRWFSHYFYNFGRNEKFGIHEPLKTFVETEYAHEMGRLYVRNFSCHFDLKREDAISAAPLAIENLRRFDIIGRTDRMSDFARDLRSATGVKCAIGRDNTGGARTRRASEVDESIIARVREICKPDYMVVEAVHRR